MVSYLHRTFRFILVCLLIYIVGTTTTFAQVNTEAVNIAFLTYLTGSGGSTLPRTMKVVDNKVHLIGSTTAPCLPVTCPQPRTSQTRDRSYTTDLAVIAIQK